MPQEETSASDLLLDATLALRTREEAARFFTDLCTIQEIRSMDQRIQVARLLQRGDTFSRVRESTGASTATISRVNRALKYGEGGYELALKRLPQSEEDK